MTRYKLLTLGLLPLSLFAAVDPTKNPQEAADGDLFLDNKQVYFINAEFLYWGVNEGALDYAVKMNNPSWSTTAPSYAVGDYKNAGFSWMPGFRLSFGYFNAPHYWDAFGQYTFLRAHGTNEEHAPSGSGEYLVGTWIGPDMATTGVATPLRKAHSSIHFDYNVIDFLFSRRFHPNPHLRINAFGGATAAIFDQHWKVRYTDFDDNQSTIRNKWNFGGAGMRLGFRIDWFMGNDLYMTGTASSGLLGGLYKNHAKQSTTAAIAGADNTIPFRNTKFRDARLTYTAQFLVGPSWQKAFESIRTELTLAYEFTMWTNLHNVYRSALAAPQAGKDTYINSSNLSLQGLTFRFNVDF